MQTCLSARLYYALILNARKPFSHLFLQRPVCVHRHGRHFSAKVFQYGAGHGSSKVGQAAFRVRASAACPSAFSPSS